MSNIINIENFKKKKHLDTQVMSFFNEQPFPFQSFHSNNSNDALVILKKEKYLFMFFEYIPEGTFTELPSVYERVEDIMKSPRISSGEWVVYDLFLLKREESDSIITNLSKNINTDDYIQKMKQKIRNIH